MTLGLKLRALALSVDGTAIGRDGKVNDTFSEVIRDLSDDILVILVTGQLHSQVFPTYSALGLSCPIVCSYGAYIYDPISANYARPNTISLQDAQAFIGKAREAGLYVSVYLTDQTIPADFVIFDENDSANTQQKYNETRVLADSDWICKLQVKGEPAALYEFSNDPWVVRRFTSVSLGHTQNDFVRIGINKGLSLAYFLTSKNIGLSETVIVGDSISDISMLKAAGVAIVMESAPLDVRCYADGVCVSLDDDFKDIMNNLF